MDDRILDLGFGGRDADTSIIALACIDFSKYQELPMIRTNKHRTNIWRMDGVSESNT